VDFYFRQLLLKLLKIKLAIESGLVSCSVIKAMLLCSAVVCTLAKKTSVHIVAKIHSSYVIMLSKVVGNKIGCDINVKLVSLESI
jgi:hypothetical protein